MMHKQVVDMFGAGMPVCALAYNCIGELVEDGETGLLFDGPAKLCDQLQMLLRGFPGNRMLQGSCVIGSCPPPPPLSGLCHPPFRNSIQAASAYAAASGQERTGFEMGRKLGYCCMADA